MPIRQASQIGSCLTIRRSHHCVGQKPPLTLDDFFNVIDTRSADDEYSSHDRPASMNPDGCRIPSESRGIRKLIAPDGCVFGFLPVGRPSGSLR